MRVDVRLVEHDLRAVLGHRRDLVVAGLGRDRLLCREGRVALQIDLGADERGLILGKLRLIHLERDLVGARIDLGEKIALLHDLAFLEPDLDQLAADLRLHRDRRQRRDRAERRQGDRHVAGRDRRGADRHRPSRGEPAGRRGLFLGVGDNPGRDASDQHEAEDQIQHPMPARRPAGWRLRRERRPRLGQRPPQRRRGRRRREWGRLVVHGAPIAARLRRRAMPAPPLGRTLSPSPTNPLDRALCSGGPNCPHRPLRPRP